MLPIIPKNKFKLKSKHLPLGGLEYTPFTVGQESILLDIADSRNKDGKKHKAKMLEGLNQIVSECIVTPNYPTKDIPLFMLEMIFLKLREKSINELVEFTYVCKAPVGEEEKPCGTTIPVTVKLEDVTLKEYPDHKRIIMVTDTIGIKFKYPTLESLEEEGGEAEAVVSCIEQIFDGDKVYDLDAVSTAALVKFYKDLEMKVKAKVLREFMNTMPNINYEAKIPCPKCGKEHMLQLTELSDFFT